MFLMAGKISIMERCVSGQVEVCIDSVGASIKDVRCDEIQLYRLSGQINRLCQDR